MITVKIPGQWKQFHFILLCFAIVSGRLLLSKRSFTIAAILYIFLVHQPIE